MYSTNPLRFNFPGNRVVSHMSTWNKLIRKYVEQSGFSLTDLYSFQNYFFTNNLKISGGKCSDA